MGRERRAHVCASHNFVAGLLSLAEQRTAADAAYTDPTQGKQRVDISYNFLPTCLGYISRRRETLPISLVLETLPKRVALHHPRMLWVFSFN